MDAVFSHGDNVKDSAGGCRYAIRVISAEGPRYGQRASARPRYFRNETLGCVYGPDTKRRKK